ncbi:amino acid ABC transporter ATP-binding protein [bacterium]|nr:amino acid ABC transporter ATP-binding protein [bacterium]
MKNVSKSFNGKKILNNISLEVPQGSVALLLGTSGVGKSTLLRLLVGLENLDEGLITLNGKKLYRNVGMVFQHFNLFSHMNVLTNITFPLEKIAKKSSQEAKEIAYTFLKKYELLDKAFFSIERLSGGQKQRLALARTIALGPEVICLDEPTSALDPLLTGEVVQSIQSLAKEGYTVVVSSHDTTLVNNLSCTIYLLNKGLIIESGSSIDIHKYPEKFPHIQAFINGTKSLF